MIAITLETTSRKYLWKNCTRDRPVIRFDKIACP